MESRLRILLLTVVLATLPGCATVRHWFHRDHPSAADSAPAEDDNTPPPRVVDPEVARRKIIVPNIRSRNIEVGINYGVISIEDFGTHPVLRGHGGVSHYRGLLLSGRGRPCHRRQHQL